jgi:hypothetical protein
MDIFETLKSMIGCLYISDLKFGVYKEQALELLGTLNLKTEEATKVYNYLGV